MTMRAKTYRSKEKAAAALGLTVAQLDLVGNAAYAVYQEVGADLAECNGGKLIKRDEVIEVALDAGRAEQMLEQRKAWRKPVDDPEGNANIDAAIAMLRKHDKYEELLGAMKLYFTSKYYE